MSSFALPLTDRPNGGLPAVVEPIRLPVQARLAAPRNMETDFQKDETLDHYADALILEHHMLAGPFEIGYCWKRKGGVSKGKSTYGKAALASGQAGFLAGVDCMIWLAADHLATMNHDFILAVLHHELLHISQDDETGNCVIAPHDFEGFLTELDRYGCFTLDLAQAKAHFEQAGLPEF